MLNKQIVKTENQVKMQFNVGEGGGGLTLDGSRARNVFFFIRSDRYRK